MKINYKASLEKGLRAGRNIDEQTDEIASVFSELNLQLSQQTDGKLEFSVKDGYISASNPKDSEWGYRIAKYTQIDCRYYPCKIEFGNTVAYCEDKPSLELTMQSMLETAMVGKMLDELLQESNEEVGV